MFYYLKRCYGKNILTIVLTLMSAAFQAATGLILVQILQELINLNFNGFVFWVLMLGAARFIAISLGCAQKIFKASAIRSMNTYVRQDLSATLSEKSYREFHEVAAGEYVSWLTNDTNQIQKLAWEPFYYCIEYGSLTLFSAVALALIHWLLLIAALVVVLIMFVLPRLFDKRLELLGQACTQEQAKATDGFKDSLSGYDIFRAFDQITRFFREMKRSSDRFEFPKFRLTCIEVVIGAGIRCVSIVCLVAFDVIVVFLALKGIILPGALLGTGPLSNDLINSTIMLANSLLSFSAAKPYFDKISVRIKDIKSEQEAMPEPFSHTIVFDKVSFDYAGDNTLSSLSLRFDKGGKYALVGPSGIGKTTVLKLLLGWLPDYHGSITFDGVDARTYTADQIQKQMSYIGQDVFLFNTTIRDNITLGEDFTEEQLQKAVKESALEADLSTMPQGLDTVVGEGGSSISGGQKQRVAIARALIHNRSILLIDEGTSALDQKNADIIEDTLLANKNLTLIMISHHLSPEKKERFTQIYDLERAYKKDPNSYPKNIHHDDAMTSTC